MTSVAVMKVNGRAVAVSGGADGTLRMWDLAQGLAIGGPLGDDDDLPGWADDLAEIDICEIDGRTVAVSAALSGHVRLWDLTKSVPAGDKKSKGKGKGKKKAKKAKTEGQRNFDGVSLGKGKDRHKRTAWAIRTGELRGQPVAVTGGEDGTVRIWDLRARTLIGQPLRGHDGPVRAVAIGDMNGVAVAASGGYDGTVRIWDVATGTPIYGPLTGHTDSVRALAIGKCQGRAVVVSGAEDQTVRVWDLATGSTEACFFVLDRVSDIAMGSGTILLSAASRVICIDVRE
jgi:WD40 repeat protein